MPKRNGQTFSGLTGRTSGLPKSELRNDKPSFVARANPTCVLASIVSTWTSGEISFTGSGSSKMALITVKIVVFAPIPNASDKTATMLKLGLFSNTRAPWRRSCQKSFTFTSLKFDVSGVPGDVGQLLFARLPLGAGKKARGNFNQAGDELENAGSAPGVPVARAVFPSVERVGHASERHVLENHFGEELEGLRLEWIVFQMAAVRSDAQSERNLF